MQDEKLLTTKSKEEDDWSLSVRILQEHIAFLREQLKDKQIWYADLLSNQKKELEDLKGVLEKERRRNLLLRVMLAEAAQSHFDRNCSSDVEADIDDITTWTEAARDIT